MQKLVSAQIVMLESHHNNQLNSLIFQVSCHTLLDHIGGQTFSSTYLFLCSYIHTVQNSRPLSSLYSTQYSTQCQQKPSCARQSARQTSNNESGIFEEDIQEVSEEEEGGLNENGGILLDVIPNSMVTY